MAAATRPSEKDWQADVQSFLFFCSEHPHCKFAEFSNWHNANYLDGPYIGGSGMSFWCAEQELMLNKLSFCRNSALAHEQAKEIMCAQPQPVVATGQPGWELVREANHDLQIGGARPGCGQVG